MQTNEQSRVEFEEWAGATGYGTMPSGDTYYYPQTASAYEGWQASRAAMKPDQDTVAQAEDARNSGTFEQRMSDWQHGDALDAERYRWLRSRDLETISQGGVFAGMTPQNVILNEEDLDQAVDVAIAAQAAKEGQQQ